MHYAFPYSFHMILFIISEILTDLSWFEIFIHEEKIHRQWFNWSRDLHGPWPMAFSVFFLLSDWLIKLHTKF